LRRRHGGAVHSSALNLRAGLRDAYDAALLDADVLAMPTAPWVAHPVAPDLPLVERVRRGWAVSANTAPANVTGHPALSLPMAESGGLPVGLMLVGRHRSDARLLAVARTIEASIGWAPHRRNS
jgi:amidase